MNAPALGDDFDPLEVEAFLERRFTSHGPHTLQTHEAEMPDCSDPDCEFHHPEVIQ